MEFDDSLMVVFPVSMTKDEFVVVPVDCVIAVELSAEEAEVVPALVALIKLDVIGAEDAVVGGFVIVDPLEMNVVDWTATLAEAEGVLMIED